MTQQYKVFRNLKVDDSTVRLRPEKATRRMGEKKKLTRLTSPLKNQLNK